MGKFSFKDSAKKNKNLKYGGYMTIVVVLALIALIIVNVLFQQLKIKVDLTPEQLYTIGSKTQLLLDEVQEDVTIYGLYVTGKENTAAISLIEDYIKHCDKLTYKQIDPYVNPEFTNQYKQADETIATKSLIVVNNATGKYKVVAESDLYQYSRTLNQQTYSYDYNITAFKAEEALTSAIQYVTSQNTPVLYMLTGHGEENLTENMQNLLKKANFDVQEFSLTGTQELAANEYTIVLINNPTSDITELEYNDLQAYMDAGGRMMFNVEYSYPENMTYFDKLLARYGVSVQRGPIIEADTSHYYQQPYIVLPDIGEHDVTEDVSKQSVIQVLPTGLAIAENRNRNTEITPILTTSEGAIIKSNLESTVMDFEEGDIKGPFYTGLMVEESNSVDGDLKYTRLAVFGSSSMFNTDSGLFSTGNYNVFYNTLNYLQTSVDSLYISPKEYTTDTLTVNASTMVTLSAVFVAVIPLALIIAGIVVWTRRKHL